jgi:mRNA interferase MazF
MVKNYIPKRGDIMWLNLNPHFGHEQGGQRPVVVVSSEVYNKIGLALVCPITSQIKGYPFEVEISGRVSGAILCDHVRNIDWRIRKATFIESVPKTLITRVQNTLQKLTIE